MTAMINRRESFTDSDSSNPDPRHFFCASRSHFTSQDYSAKLSSEFSPIASESLFMSPRHSQHFSSFAPFTPGSVISFEAVHISGDSSHSHSYSMQFGSPLSKEHKKRPSLPVFTHNPSSHMRQSSIIVNNVNQTYSQMLSIVENPNDSLCSSPSKMELESMELRTDMVKMSLRQAFNESQGLDSTKANETSGRRSMGTLGLGHPQTPLKHTSHLLSTTTNNSMGSVPNAKSAFIIDDEEPELADEYSGSIHVISNADCEPVEGSSAYFTEEKLNQCAVTGPTTATNTEGDPMELDFGELHQQRFRYERDIRQARGKLMEPQFGMLPTRTYCDRCKMDVSTRVSMELPKLPM